MQKTLHDCQTKTARKSNLDIFWLKDESLEDTENLPAPEVLAAEIAENLQSALEQFNSILDDLKRE